MFHHLTGFGRWNRAVEDTGSQQHLRSLNLSKHHTKTRIEPDRYIYSQFYIIWIEVMEVKDTVEILDPGMVCLNPLLLFWRPNLRMISLLWRRNQLWPQNRRCCFGWYGIYILQLTDLQTDFFFIKFEILLCRSYLTALGKPPLTGQTISAPRPPRHRPRSSNPARSKSWARRQSLLSHVLDGKLTWKVRILVNENAYALYHPFTQFGILWYHFGGKHLFHSLVEINDTSKEKSGNMDGEQGDKDPATKVVPTPVRSSIPEPPVQTTVVVEKVEQQPAQQEEVPPNVNVNEDKTKLEQTPETDQPPLVQPPKEHQAPASRKAWPGFAEVAINMPYYNNSAYDWSSRIRLCRSQTKRIHTQTYTFRI